MYINAQRIAPLTANLLFIGPQFKGKLDQEKDQEDEEEEKEKENYKESEGKEIEMKEKKEEITQLNVTRENMFEYTQNNGENKHKENKHADEEKKIKYLRNKEFYRDIMNKYKYKMVKSYKEKEEESFGKN